jgi:biopolymer transport protein ExbD
MTSLIDVIFLLLLFFMLSSTFSTFAEVELAAASGGATASDEPPIFVQLFEDRLTVNGIAEQLDTLSLDAAPDQVVLVALQAEVSAQRLTDLLVALRSQDGLRVSVLGAG